MIHQIHKNYSSMQHSGISNFNETPHTINSNSTSRYRSEDRHNNMGGSMIGNSFEIIPIENQSSLCGLQ